MKYLAGYLPTMPIAQPQLTKPWLTDQRLLTLIIVVCTSYQALLCLLNTLVLPSSRAMVGIAEAMILLACVPFLIRRLLPGVLALACIAGASLCIIDLVNEQFDLKPFRDLFIPLCFFWLGCNIGSITMADRALKATIWVVLAMGMFEAIFVDYYTQLFDIFGYYINIGSASPVTDYVRESRLQLNGLRPEGIGRTLLPSLLGPHRVSSVFLEPISLGNFATLCAAWGLCRGKEEWRSSVFFIAAAVVMIILADSRFALMTVSLLVLLRLLLRGASINLTIAAPFVAVIMLVVVGLMTDNDALHEDNLRGRFAFSGWLLMDFTLSMLFATDAQLVYFDQGYAHILTTFSLPLCLLFWFSFWLLPMPTAASRRFRALVSIYIALILCISGTSFFALKSAGLLWFLVGCSLQKPAPTPRQITHLIGSLLPHHHNDNTKSSKQSRSAYHVE
jgi:putative polymerase